MAYWVYLKRLPLSSVAEFITLSSKAQKGLQKGERTLGQTKGRLLSRLALWSGLANQDFILCFLFIQTFSRRATRPLAVALNKNASRQNKTW